MTDGPTDDPIPPDDWATIVRNVPVVSVDLLVLADDGLVLGKRTNEPARGVWFPPGGTVFKGESLEDAVHRVATEEIGTDVRIDRQLGVYEHFYDTADVPDADGKHYVAVAYAVTPVEAELRPDDQHAALETFATPESDLDLHPYVERYVADLDELDELGELGELDDGT